MMLQPSREQAYKAQVAALPIRARGAGLDVLLITSRETKRWVIPKGWPMKGRKDHQAAALEARQEAGVAGRIEKRPLGAFTYQKRLTDRVEPCRVMVYCLAVDLELTSWREKDQRKRKWFSQKEAAYKVSEPGLASMILALDAPCRTLAVAGEVEREPSRPFG